MTKILYIDCCIRKSESRTRRLANSFLGALEGDFDLKTLVLDEENLEYLSGDTFLERESLQKKGELNHPLFRYAREFSEADKIVIAAPFWDLSIPALLKVYLENISVDRITFGYGETGRLTGLCKATDLVFITTRGGFYRDTELEMGAAYLKALSVFFGINHFHCIDAEGLDAMPDKLEELLNEAQLKAVALAKNLS